MPPTAFSTSNEANTSSAPNRITKADEIQYVAIHFTNYLIRHRHITLHGKIPLENLTKLFVTYQADNPSRVSSTEIVTALKNTRLLKKKQVANNVIEFKDQVFQSRKAVTVRKEDVERPIVRIFTNQNYNFRNTLQKDKDFKENECLMCRKKFNTPNEYAKHCDTLNHKLRKVYRDTKYATVTCCEQSFLLQFEGLAIDIQPQYRLEVKKAKTVIAQIKNTSNQRVTIEYVEKLNDLKEIKMPAVEGIPKCLNAGDTLQLSIIGKFLVHGERRFPVVLGLRGEEMENVINVLLEPTFSTASEEFEDLKATVPYTPTSTNFQLFEDLPIISATPTRKPKDSLVKKFKPLKYEIPASVVKILNHKFQKFEHMTPADKNKYEEMMKLLCNRERTTVVHNREVLDSINYVVRFHHLLWIEEHQMNKDIHTYDLRDVELLTDRGSVRYFGIQVPGLEEGRPSLVVGNRVYIRRKNDKAKYEGIVEIVECSRIYVTVNRALFEKYVPKELVDVEFSFFRDPIRYSHRALGQAEKRKVVPCLFPSQYGTNTITLPRMPVLDRPIETNQQQKQAVQNIIRNTAYPAPYIVYGPPGTGKTSTIVEAIGQIHRLFPNKKICICAPSNVACDVIGVRLRRSAGVPESSIFRIYSLCRVNHSPPPELEKCCNRRNGAIEYPSVDEIKAKKIIIMTPIAVGKLVSAGFEGGWFDYLFVDEAGYATEVELLVPIIGLLTNDRVNTFTGSLVLTGDPKQLGPIVRSTLAVNLGHDISLLERLMKTIDIYQKIPAKKEYNSNVITKLLNNYRSHEVILHVPNKCFYDGDLVPKASKDKISLACEWIGLPRPNFPLIFHSVKGIENQERNSPSYFNVIEIQMVMEYVRSLIGSKLRGRKVTEEDIGIIAPYRKQVQKIREACRKTTYKNITISSVEEFQGQEKNIVIISTVRSGQQYLATDYQFGLGFLRNNKRFNVALTRAAALLVIVGNPDVLQCDAHWRALMDYCRANNSYKGDPPSGDIPDGFDVNSKLEMKLPSNENTSPGSGNDIGGGNAIEPLTLSISQLTVMADEVPVNERPSFRQDK